MVVSGSDGAALAGAVPSRARNTGVALSHTTYLAQPYESFGVMSRLLSQTYPWGRAAERVHANNTVPFPRSISSQPLHSRYC